MKRIILFVIAFLAAGAVLLPLAGLTNTGTGTGTASGAAPDFEKMWGEVAQASKDDLPVTAQGIVRKIYDAATVQGDAFQRLRAADMMLALKRKVDWKSVAPYLDSLRRSDSTYSGEGLAVYRLMMARWLANNRRYGNDTGLRYTELPVDKWGWQCYLDAIRDLIVPEPDPATTAAVAGKKAAPFDTLISVSDSAACPPCTLEELLLRGRLEVMLKLRQDERDNSFVDATFARLLEMHRDNPACKVVLLTRQVIARYPYFYDDRNDIFLLDSIAKAFPDESNVMLPISEKMNRMFIYGGGPDSTAAADMLRTCEELLDRFPGSPYRDKITAIAERLTAPDARIEFPSQFYPGKEGVIALNHANIPYVYMEVYQLDLGDTMVRRAAEINDMGRITDDFALQLKIRGALVLRNEHMPLENPLYKSVTTRIPLKLDSAGLYLLSMANFQKAWRSDERVVVRTNALLRVGRLGVLSRSRSNRYEIYAADLMTGKPVEAIDLTMRTLTDSEAGTGDNRDTTIRHYDGFPLDGFTPLPGPTKEDNGRTSLRISYGDEAFYPFTYYSIFWNDSRQTARRCAIYTDRGRYLPGDTVRFKGVFYDVDTKGARVLPDAGGKLWFVSPSDQTIATLDVTSNEWGSFEGSFAVPATGSINGSYSIRIDKNFTGGGWVRVESYKRPSIFVSLGEPGRGYRFGDTVRLAGSVRSFAGFGVSGAKVGYKVTRSRNFLFWDSGMIFFPSETVASGYAVSGRDGGFAVAFYAGKPDLKRGPGIRGGSHGYLGRTSATFEVEITATDEKGESQQAAQQIFISNVPYVLSTKISPAIDREHPDSLMVEVRDGYGKAEGVKCGYSIWSGDKVVRKGVLTGWKAVKPDLAGLPQGRYRLEYFTADTSLARSVSNDFILFSAREKSVPVDTVGFFAPLQLRGNAKQPAEFLFGTSRERIYARMEILFGDSLLLSKPVVFPRGMQRVSVPYPDSWPATARLMLTYVYGGAYYTEKADLERVVETPSITMRLVSLRTPTEPGSHERFFVEVKDDKGKPTQAEVVVAVYDKATDVDEKRSFDPLDIVPYKNRTPYALNAIGFGRSYGFFQSTRLADMGVSTGDDGLVFIGYGASRREDLTGSLTSMISGRVTGKTVTEDTNLYSLAAPAPMNFTPPVVGQEMLQNAARSGNMRRNLSQTAAFLPHVTTDSKGMADISFILPDNLTTYRILAMAHTKEALSTVASAEMVVRKELMVMPNIPQFVREGDSLVVRTTVMNLTGKVAAGEARIELFDPADSALVALPGLGPRPVNIEAEGKQVVAWGFVPPVGKRLLGIRIAASTPTHSDGVEVTIPVMPSREEFVRSKSFILPDTGSVDLDPVALIGERNLAKESLQVQVSSPKRLVLLSLPAASIPASNGLVDIVSAWYINLCGRRMLYDDSRYAGAVKSWVRDSSLMKDPLESGSEAVGTLLSETPWARVPGINRRRIAALNNMLDPKFMSAMIKDFYAKLLTVRNPDGGLAWFPGMPSSPLLTMWFLDRAGELLKMKAIIFNNVIHTSTNGAKYLDGIFLKSYRDEMALGEKARPERVPFEVIQYLSARAPFLKDIPLSDDVQQAWEYYMSKLERTWTSNSIFERIYICKALDADGRYIHIPAILRSLSEYAVRNETMGTYFPNLVMPFKGLMSSEIKAHAMALELFASRPEYAPLAGGIAQWLMLQRRNQMWENNVATADAVYALWKFYSMDDRDKDASVRYQITVPDTGKRYDTFNGYTIEPAVIRKGIREGGKMTVVNECQHPLFVDLVYRFEDELSQVQQYSEGISVERTFFRLSFAGGKEVYEPLTDTTTLHVGERVVARYSIHSTENRSFVALKALRPGALQPESAVSGYMFFGFYGGYRDVRESFTNYFFNMLPEGDSSVEERFFVSYEGRFSTAVARIISLYAPQYGGNAGSGVLIVAQ